MPDNERLLSADPRAGVLLSSDPRAGRVATQASMQPTGEQAPAVERFATELYRNSPLAPVVNTLAGAWNVAQDPIGTYGGLKPLGGTLLELARAQWTEAETAAQKARDAWAGDRLAIPEAIGHGVAAAIPVLGPAAANAGRMFGEGDVAGGAGAAVGMLLPFGVKYAREVGATRSAVPTPTRVQAANEARARTLADQARAQVAEQVLAPGNVKYRQPAADIAERVARTDGPRNRVELRQFADDLADDATSRIDAAIVAQPGQLINVRGALQQLQTALDKLAFNGKVIAGNERLAAELQTKWNELRAGAGRGNTVPIERLVEFRRQLDDIAKRNGAFEGDPRLSAQTDAVLEASNAIRSELAKARPDLADANADFTFASQLRDVLSPSKGRPKVLGAQPHGQTGGIRAAGSIAASNVPGLKTVAPLAGELYARLQQYLNSDSYKLADAKTKLALADALKRGDTGRVTRLLHAARMSGAMAAGAIGEDKEQK
jgi:hypothetical protein